MDKIITMILLKKLFIAAVMTSIVETGKVGLKTNAGQNVTEYCEMYPQQGICDVTDPVQTDKGRLVYIGKSESQMEKEKLLQLLLSKINNHHYVSCINFIKHVLCYQLYPLCPREEGGVPRIVKRTCREDCHIVKTTLCVKAIEHIPELKQILIDVNCSSLPSTDCLHLTIPSERETIENSCMKTHAKPEPYFAKVSTLKTSACKTILVFNSHFYYPSILHYQHGVYNSWKNKPICVFKTKSIKNIIENIQLDNIQKLRNFEVQNIISFKIHKYCFLYKYDHSIGYFKGTLGDVREYRPHKYLTLTNVVFSLIKNKDTYSIVGEGTHELCYTRFQYIIMAENKMVDIFHAVSQDSIKMSLIELSHTIKRWVGKQGRHILKDQFMLFSTLSIHRPTWSIIWLNEERISGFKGTSSIKFKHNVLKNVATELIIGVEQDFWMLRMRLNKIKFYDLLDTITSSYGLPIEYMPYVNEKWNDEMIISKAQFTFATTDIKLPFSLYATQKYDIYKEFLEGRIIEGTKISVNGIIKKPVNGEEELPLLEDRIGFTISVSMYQNDTMTFDLLFQRNSKQMICSDKKEQEWKRFFNLIETVQKATYNNESKTIKMPTDCTICCNTNKNILHSIKGKLYYDIDFLFGKVVFLDFDINILNGKKLIKHQIRGYNPFSAAFTG